MNLDADYLGRDGLNLKRTVLLVAILSIALALRATAVLNAVSAHPPVDYDADDDGLPTGAE